MSDPNNKFDVPKIRDGLQQIILGVMEDGMPFIPDDVPILDLGVSSLALVEGMRQVFDRFGVLVSIRQVIEGQITIGSLALYIEQELNRQKASRKKEESRRWEVERQIPTTPSQQHVAFLSRYSGEAGASFNEALVIQLDGTLHGPALHAAIEEVGKRYESLRTALDPEENVLNLGTGQILELQSSPVSPKELQARLTEIVSRPFEIGRRLFRAELLRLTEHQHILVLVGHALVIDHRSLTLILEDVASLYGLFLHDQEANTPPLSLQWTDYLALSDTSEAQNAHQQAEGFWKDLLADDLPQLELPADYPRPPVKKYSGARLELALGSAICERLETFATSENVVLEAVLLAAYIVYLHRLSNVDSLVIGIESTNLYLDGETPAIANTGNMLPLLMSFNPTSNFREQVHAVSEAMVQANTHRHISLYRLTQLLDLPRDQSRSPVFTAAFRSQNDDAVPVFDGLQCEYHLSPSSGARYDIELIIRNQKNQISLVSDFSTELFDTKTVSRWLNGITTLLDAALQDSSQPCSLLPLIPEDELEMMLIDWNQTKKAFPQEHTVLDLVTEQAQQRGDALAVRFGSKRLSYSQLLQRADQIAGALHQQGIKHGDRVGILMRRSLDLIPAIMATWRIGAVYVPLDSAFPKKRIAYMLSDADVQVVLTNQDLKGLLQGNTQNVLFVEDITSEANDELESATGSDSAYIMYTSGSTGKPKGVEIGHNSLLNVLLAVRDFVEFTPASRMFALTTISFDISTVELFMPLIAGGSVELAEDGLVANGLELAEQINSHSPTHVQATPSTWKSVLKAGWQGDPEIYLLSAGEALRRDLAEQLLKRSHTLWNLYGPTETTVYSSGSNIDSSPDEPIAIGRPFPNTQLYILDERLQPLPIGAVGDLYIGGIGLAAGYWQRPERTDQRFVDNPFKPGKRMYLTGDLARYMPDGNIIWLGRSDEQVKIHGVRVELGEVETALTKIEGIHDAVVVAWEDKHGDNQLVGHVIAGGDDSLTASNIRTQLREHLSATMIPPHILFAKSFPKTTNGKIHHAALQQPSPLSGSIPSGLSIEKRDIPSTPTEQKVAQAWARVLEIDAGIITRTSNFMDLGGHSLLMTRLMIEIRKLFEVSFNLSEFFESSTLEKFAALVDKRKRDADENNGDLPSQTQTLHWARQRMAFLQREAQLPRYIAPGRGLVYQPVDEIRTVFLTGATGFLGVYILSEILNTTDADLYCLVRPRRGEEGKSRIEKQMKQYRVWAEGEAWQTAWEQRVHVVDGDVTLPRLGMKSQEYESLAREVDMILHGAAHVNFIYPYEALRATNVLGIHEIIQFAFYGRIKPVHHLSTAAIWPMGAQNTYFEKDSIDHYGLLNLGYDEAKWVGEKCLVHAAERGLPVARYRPGEVGGDSQTGRCVTDHFIIACLKGFLQFGAFPDLDIEMDIAPVDYVAKAIVYMIFHRKVLGRAFHLTNPSRRRLKDGLAYLRGAGYQFDLLSFVDLRDRLVASPNFADNVLFAYQAALESMDEVSMQLPTYDTSETQRELAESGIVCPPADEKLFGTYLRYLQEIEFIPLPNARVAAK